MADDIPALVAELEEAGTSPCTSFDPVAGAVCSERHRDITKWCEVCLIKAAAAALSRLTRALAERDAALAEMTRVPLCPLEDYKAQRERADAAEAEDTRKLLLLTAERHQRATAERERDEARAALARYEADDRRIRSVRPER